MTEATDNLNELVCTLQQDVINGFSYSFCKSLLAKLIEIEADDANFMDNLLKNHDVKSILDPIWSHLSNQMPGINGNLSKHRRGDVKVMIGRCQEFFEIFEKRQRKQDDT